MKVCTWFFLLIYVSVGFMKRLVKLASTTLFFLANKEAGQGDKPSAKVKG